MERTTMRNEIPVLEGEGWYVHGPEEDEDCGYLVCRTFEDMWVTLRKEFDTLEEAMDYAMALNEGRHQLSNVNA